MLGAFRGYWLEAQGTSAEIIQLFLATAFISLRITGDISAFPNILCAIRLLNKMTDVYFSCVFIQGESLDRDPELLSIKNYVIEIMTWKFIYTYRERCKTGPAHNRCWNWSPVTSKHTWMRFTKFWNIFPKVSTLTAWISWRIASLSCSIVRDVFLYTLPFNRPQRKKSAGVRSASPCL